MLPFSRSAMSSPRSIVYETVAAQDSTSTRSPDSKDNTLNQNLPAALKDQALLKRVRPAAIPLEAIMV
jgi:hypothetical protein